ncbi:MAG: hypothetical protein U0176_14885 [Bacteroidia bacterium]
MTGQAVVKLPKGFVSPAQVDVYDGKGCRMKTYFTNGERMALRGEDYRRIYFLQAVDAGSRGCGADGG